MEPHQQVQQQQSNQIRENVDNNRNILCRQSRPRWTPTTDQIRILKNLYYNDGVRSPTLEQIQKISSKLRHYGKITSRNVFYWFQNHKAREKQRKKFIIPTNHHRYVIPLHNNNNNIRPGGFWKNDGVLTVYNDNTQIPNIISQDDFNSSSICPSPGVVPVGKYCYGSLFMDKSFHKTHAHECSITPSARDASNNYNWDISLGHKFGWMDTSNHHYHHHHAYSSSAYPFNESIGNCVADKQTLELNEHEKDDHETPKIKTLSLFPINDSDGDNKLIHNIG